MPAIQGGRRGLQRFLVSYGAQIVVLAAAWVYFIANSETFRGVSAVYPVLQGFALVGLVALGLAVTMIAGELDLSVASMTGLAGIVAVKCASTGLVPTLAITFAFGACFGILQGLVITRFGVNSLVLTVGTLILLKGAALVITHEVPVSVSNIALGDPLLQQYWIFSLSSIVALVIFVLVGFFLAYTARGREIYAVGGGRPEAMAAGVRCGRAIVTAFMISGALAALAGGLSAIQGGIAGPNNFSTLLLTAATAALVGGVALSGGRGTVFNVALGVALVSLIASGLADRGVEGNITQLVNAGLLIAVIALEFGARRVRRMRERSLIRRELIVQPTTQGS